MVDNEDACPDIFGLYTHLIADLITPLDISGKILHRIAYSIGIVATLHRHVILCKGLCRLYDGYVICSTCGHDVLVTKGHHFMLWTPGESYLHIMLCL